MPGLPCALSSQRDERQTHLGRLVRREPADGCLIGFPSAGRQIFSRQTRMKNFPLHPDRSAKLRRETDPANDPARFAGIGFQEISHDILFHRPGARIAPPEAGPPQHDDDGRRPARRPRRIAR